MYAEIRVKDLSRNLLSVLSHPGVGWPSAFLQACIGCSRLRGGDVRPLPYQQRLSHKRRVRNPLYRYFFSAPFKSALCDGAQRVKYPTGTPARRLIDVGVLYVVIVREWPPTMKADCIHSRPASGETRSMHVGPPCPDITCTHATLKLLSLYLCHRPGTVRSNLWLIAALHIRTWKGLLADLSSYAGWWSPQVQPPQPKGLQGVRLWGPPSSVAGRVRQQALPPTYIYVMQQSATNERTVSGRWRKHNDRSFKVVAVQFFISCHPSTGQSVA